MIFGLGKFQLFLALVIFLPAGSLRFWQGWLYWLIFGLMCLVLGLYFARHDPALVSRRMQIADAFVILGAYGFYVTFRENSYAASTVTVETGQPVISSGPYACVRHPMYTAAIILFAATPVALASWWGLVPAAMLAALIVWRLIDEEGYLARHLAGYTDYQQRVRARLVPGVW